MTAAKNFKGVKTCLAKRLAPFGFSAAGDIFSRNLSDTLVVLEIQKDRHSTKDEIRFTVNVGISVNALRAIAAAAVGASSADVPSPSKCHWRERLGLLMPVRRDLWWSVRDEETAQAVCDEVTSGVVEDALPQIEDVASTEVLIAQWQSGRGYGLTEYERRSNLARLLCALGRIEETQEAIQALEDASIGKSWEVSARYDVKELRKQFS